MESVSPQIARGFNQPQLEGQDFVNTNGIRVEDEGQLSTEHSWRIHGGLSSASSSRLSIRRD